MAARNVLLTHDLKAKVADFGLSDRIYSTFHVIKGPEEQALPVKWCGPEILKNGVPILEKSDVWSFGITLWEIYSLCQNSPYNNLDIQYLLHHLSNGTRLSKPNLCPNHVYEIMWSCWIFNFENRPTFKELIDLLKRPKNNNVTYPQIDDLVFENLEYFSELQCDTDSVV